MKTIVIDGKEYPIECNAFTFVEYKKIFKTDIFKDIEKIQTSVALQTINKEKIEKENPNIEENELEEKLGKLMYSIVDDFISSITQMAWILIYSYDENIEEYNKWLRNIHSFSINDKWIVEVTKFVVDCFR